MAATRKKTTVYFDSDLLRAVQDEATRSGRRDYEILEDAVRRYLAPQDPVQARQELRAFLDRLEERPGSDEREILDLAYDELHTTRRERRARPR